MSPVENLDKSYPVCGVISSSLQFTNNQYGPNLLVLLRQIGFSWDVYFWEWAFSRQISDWGTSACLTHFLMYNGSNNWWTQVLFCANIISVFNNSSIPESMLKRASTDMIESFLGYVSRGKNFCIYDDDKRFTEGNWKLSLIRGLLVWDI